MKIFPKATIQTLDTCKAGQLVRTLTYRESSFGIVCDIETEGKRAIVTISTEQISYETFLRPEEISVLLYDGEPVWQINQDGPFEGYAEKIYNRNGCIVYKGENLCMIVNHSNNIRGYRKYFDMRDSLIINYHEELRDICAFGAWSLYLEDKERPIENRFKIASFDVTTPIEARP